MEVSRAVASVQPFSVEISLLLLSNRCFGRSLFKLPVLVSSACCDTVTPLLLEMATSPEKKRGLSNRVKPGSSLSSLLDVT